MPAEIKKSLALSLSPIKTQSKGWENPLDYHLTLLFIGETLKANVESITSRLDHISFQPFKLTTDKLEFFPRRVLYLSFAPSLPLMQLRDQIAQMYPEYLKPTDKPFTAHLTIKRWQRYEYDELCRNIQAYPLAPMEFAVKHVALFKSEKDAEGQKYHVIQKK